MVEILSCQYEFLILTYPNLAIFLKKTQKTKKTIMAYMVVMAAKQCEYI